jgi:hypothetical protein
MRCPISRALRALISSVRRLLGSIKLLYRNSVIGINVQNHTSLDKLTRIYEYQYTYTYIWMYLAGFPIPLKPLKNGKCIFRFLYFHHFHYHSCSKSQEQHPFLVFWFGWRLKNQYNDSFIIIQTMQYITAYYHIAFSYS